MKAVAKKINKGNYSYKGFNIYFTDLSKITEGDLHIKYWSIKGVDDGSPCEGTNSLKNALWIIDNELIPQGVKPRC